MSKAQQQDPIQGKKRSTEMLRMYMQMGGMLEGMQQKKESDVSLIHFWFKYSEINVPTLYIHMVW